MTFTENINIHFGISDYIRYINSTKILADISKVKKEQLTDLSNIYIILITNLLGSQNLF